MPTRCGTRWVGAIEGAPTHLLPAPPAARAARPPSPVGRAARRRFRSQPARRARADGVTGRLLRRRHDRALRRDLVPQPVPQSGSMAPQSEGTTVGPHAQRRGTTSRPSRRRVQARGTTVRPSRSTYWVRCDAALERRARAPVSRPLAPRRVPAGSARVRGFPDVVRIDPERGPALGADKRVGSGLTFEPGRREARGFQESCLVRRMPVRARGAAVVVERMSSRSFQASGGVEAGEPPAAGRREFLLGDVLAGHPSMGGRRELRILALGWALLSGRHPCAARLLDALRTHTGVTP